MLTAEERTAKAIETAAGEALKHDNDVAKGKEAWKIGVMRHRRFKEASWLIKIVDPISNVKPDHGLPPASPNTTASNPVEESDAASTATSQRSSGYLKSEPIPLTFSSMSSLAYRATKELFTSSKLSPQELNEIKKEKHIQAVLQAKRLKEAQEENAKAEEHRFYAMAALKLLDRFRMPSHHLAAQTIDDYPKENTTEIDDYRQANLSCGRNARPATAEKRSEPPVLLPTPSHAEVTNELARGYVSGRHHHYKGDHILYALKDFPVTHKVLFPRSNQPVFPETSLLPDETLRKKKEAQRLKYEQHKRDRKTRPRLKQAVVDFSHKICRGLETAEDNHISQNDSMENDRNSELYIDLESSVVSRSLRSQNSDPHSKNDGMTNSRRSGSVGTASTSGYFDPERAAQEQLAAAGGKLVGGIHRIRYAQLHTFDRNRSPQHRESDKHVTNANANNSFDFDPEKASQLALEMKMAMYQNEDQHTEASSAMHSHDATRSGYFSFGSVNNEKSKLIKLKFQRLRSFKGLDKFTLRKEFKPKLISKRTKERLVAEGDS